MKKSKKNLPIMGEIIPNKKLGNKVIYNKYYKEASDYYDMIILIKQWSRVERFGQYLWNAMAIAGYWDSPEANNLFFISNEDLIKILEKYDNL